MRIPAWEGQWKERVHARLLERDFSSLTIFADARPTATLQELAEELGPQGDVAPVQIEWLLRIEAEDAGRIHRFARSALVRQIHEFFPQGWNRAARPAPGPSSPEEWCRSRVYSTWSTEIGEEHDAVADRVFDALEKLAPHGWLPAGPDDPIIAHAFRDGRFPEDKGAGEKRSSS
jgi:hypothetical protein